MDLMERVNRKAIGKTTLDGLVNEREAKEPGVRAAHDTQVQALDLGRRLAALRKSRGLTQDELAHKADSAQETIARIEAGKAVPKLDLLARLAAACGKVLTVEFANSSPRAARKTSARS
jgi:DNA-binding XRE family transcriptional regulator